MPTIGIKPQPRALFQGLSDGEVDELSGLFPTSRVINHLDEVRQAEWDVLITKNGCWPEAHVFTLSFGARRVVDVDGGYGADEGYSWALDYSGYSKATEFVFPDDLPAGLARLIETDLLPKVKQREKNAVVCSDWVYGNGAGSGARPVEYLNFKKFLSTTERNHLAGSVSRNGGRAEAWSLPFADLNVVAWVKAALKQWHKKDPIRFPINPGWEHQSEWMTQVESELAGKIDQLLQERHAYLAQSEGQERQLRAHLQQATMAADSGERRLLTAQDESLVEAVAAAFRELGLETQDMDQVFPANDRREDLRVRVPGDTEWVAICEVKGYYKGAKINDLLKVGRFRARFIQEQQRAPGACWYVVNSYVQDDPTVRGKPLGANSEEVETFAEDGGLVLGTADLFRLLMAVRTGKLSAADAQSRLRKATGVFEF